MLQIQFKFIVKNELVAMKGFVTLVVGSVFSASTRKVPQFPSTFSTRKTGEQESFVVPAIHVIFSLVVGIDQGLPLAQQVYNITGLVLAPIVVAGVPRNPRSQVSRQPSPQQQAFFCKIHIVVKISAIQFASFFSQFI